MSGSINSSTALLTEHLRHTPVSLLDDIINSINTIGYKAVDWVEQGLLGTPLSNLGFTDASNCKSDQDSEDIESRARHEIENGVHQFETLLEATIDKNFDKMEIFALRSIIAIPEDLKDWIQLRHYEGLNLTPSLTPDAPTLDSITLQRRKHQETLRLHRLLQAETARNSTLIAQMKSLLSASPPNLSPLQNPASQQNQSSKTPKLEPQDTAMADDKTEKHDDEHQKAYPTFAFLASKGDLHTTSAATPLSTTTAFALSQLPAMKSLLSDLHPSLQTLSSPLLPSSAENPNLSKEGQEEAKSWRQQRLEYIETQTRRLHENVRGLELGPQGRVRDGEWQEEGRRVGRGEVEALERVVGLVGGERGKGLEEEEEEDDRMEGGD